MTIRSPHRPVPLPGLRLTEFVLARAAGSGGKPAIIDGTTGQAISYRELTASVTRGAAALIRCGVARGDVVALASQNSPGYAVMFHAAALAGAAVTTINPLAPAAEMARQLGHSGARWLAATPSLLRDKGHQAAAAAGLGGGVLEFAAAHGTIPAGPPGAGRPLPARPGMSVDDLVYLPYSSGTTGLPKGVMITHRNLVANLAQIRAVQRLAPGDVVLAALPWFHMFGQLTLNLALRAGATVVTKIGRASCRERV